MGAPYRFVSYRVEERVAHVRIERPEVMNALHADAHAELRDVFERFRDGDDAGVAIITGSGDRAFSAGNDLKVTAARARDGHPVSPSPVPFGGITWDFPCNKPIIAAVNGFALGGGFELVLACDVAVAARHARFGLPEPRVGLVAGAGGMHRLARQLPFKVAMGMLLTGRHITADEAWRLGLVNEVVASEELLPAAQRWAVDVLACSPNSVRTTKEAVLEGLGRSAEEAMRDDRMTGRLQRVFDSPDASEGPAAFAEKRQARWTSW